ncbi:hypothetical protein S245_048981, partial [Arachis hypogaea]
VICDAWRASPYKQETQCCQDLQSPLYSLSGTMRITEITGVVVSFDPKPIQ